MRRAIASGLLCVLALLLIGPAAFVPDPEGNLPACCRRDGSHHCALARNAANVSGGLEVRRVTPLCPLFPETVIAFHGVSWDPHVWSVFAVVASERFEPLELALSIPVASGQAHQERGPPRNSHQA